MTEVVRLKSPGGPNQLEMLTIDLPPCKSDHIRVRQTAIGVNFIDIYQREGRYPLPPDAIPGVEAVGRITEIGADVRGLEVGDAIVYAGAPFGAYAAERHLPAWRAVLLERDVSDAAVASTFLKGLTAHMLLNRVYSVKQSDIVLVRSAAGGLGQIRTRWAAHLGAIVIGTVGSEAKAVVAREAGADHVIVGRNADVVGEVRHFTSGRGVDVAYDGIGGKALAVTLGCMRPFGVVASLGQTAGSIPAIDVDELGPKRSIMLARPSVMAYINDSGTYHAAASDVLSALQSGFLQSKATWYRLTEAAQAHRDLESGKSSGSLYLVP